MPITPTINALHGQRVEVYRNLHKGCWSVRHEGRVVAHLKSLTLAKCTFAVQPAGNRKVRETGRKNVHAFVRGQFLGTAEWELPYTVSYNPHKNTTFVIGDDPVFEADYVTLKTNHTVEADFDRRMTYVASGS